MALATQSINLDLRPHYNRQNINIVYCSQYDSELRNVVANIASEGTAVDVSTYTIYVEGTKPDKKGFSYELTAIGGTVSNNVVTFPLQLQMTAVAGITYAELVFYSGDQRIGSSNFILAVEKAGLADDVDVSETDIPAYVDGAQQAAAAAEQAKDTAVEAAETAQQVKDSIPADYTELSDSVLDLKNALEMGATSDGNQWNPSEESENKVVSNQTSSLGQLTDQNGYKTSGMIAVKTGDVIRWAFSNTEVEEGATLTISGNAYRIAEYDASKTCLLVTPSWVSVPYTVQNANTAYIRVSATSKPINYIDINGSSSAIVYEKFSEKSNRLADIENDINEVKEATEYRTHSKNWFDPSTVTVTTQGTKEIYYTDYIPVSEGETLYASKSFDSYSTDTMTVESFYLINIFDANKNPVGNSGYWKTSYVIPSGVAYVRCYVGFVDYAKVMIEKDTQTLTWEAYWNSGYIADDVIARQNVNNIDTAFLYSCVNMFDRIGGVGDSYTAGYAKGSDGSYNTNQDHTYIGVMAKRAGINYAIYAKAGATTRSYITEKLSELLADATCDFYMLALGINDVGLGTSYIGTIADIDDNDYTQNADSFFGNYGKIIAQIKAHAPKALFCIVRIPLCGTNVKYFDYAIDEIGQHYGIPVIDPYDDDFFKSAIYEDKSDGHPTITGYTGMALAYERLLSKAVHDNPTYFKFATIG